MPTIDLTQREKAVVDALRLLDGEEHNREQNFMRIVSEYRAHADALMGLLSASEARVAELEAVLTRIRTENLSRFDCTLLAAQAQGLLK